MNSTDENKRAPRIFISYKRSDIERVRWLYDCLRYAGYEVFLDEEIPVAAAFESYLMEKINYIDFLLVVWSKDSIASEWVHKEVDAALQAGKLVIPVGIDKVLPPEKYSHLNIADLSNWQGNISDVQWQKVIAIIGQGKRTAKNTVIRPILSWKMLYKNSQALSAPQINISENDGHVVIRAKSLKEFNKQRDELVRRRYYPVKVEDDLAIFQKTKKVNWLVAISCSFFVIPLIIYYNIYKRLPKVEVVKVVLVRDG